MKLDAHIYLSCCVTQILHNDLFSSLLSLEITELNEILTFLSALFTLILVLCKIWLIFIKAILKLYALYKDKADPYKDERYQ